MSRSMLRHSLSGASLALLLGACASPQFGNPCPIPDDATAAERTAAIKKCLGSIGDQVVDARLKKDVDILFLIDNSPSMSPKQEALARNFEKFMTIIDETGANYHVGVATSDIGSNIMPGINWGGSLGQCDTFEGDDGVLQNLACSDRMNLTSEGRSACAKVCPDPRFVPTDGRRFVSRVDGVTNVPKALMADPQGKMVDYGPINAFKCMALVGDGGCGIEGQLEGAKRALDGHRSENAGFLRNNSVLAVIFITDEDDCSVQLKTRDQNNPTTRDCPDGDQNASYDCYGVDYRCLARSIQCDQPMNTPGVKTNCKERTNNYLEKLENYYKFFSNLRPANRLVVSGVWTLPSIDKGGKVVIAKGTSGTTTPFLNRAGGSDAACQYTGGKPEFAGVFGQTQLRLSKFAQMFGKDEAGNPAAPEVSICDIDGYPAALDKLAKAIAQKLNASCLPVVPKVEGGKPVCLVGDVDENSDKSSPDVLFPTCSANCCNAWASSDQPTPADENIVKACTAETADCYCAVKSKAPTKPCSETVVAGVWRKGNVQPPPGKVVSFRCAGGG